MAPGVLLTDWPAAHRGGRQGGSAVAAEDLVLALNCGLHSSEVALDPGLTAPPIITQSDRVTGAACLSPVLNHSISAGGGGGGGTGGGGEDLEYLSFPKRSHEATLVQAIVALAK